MYTCTSSAALNRSCKAKIHFEHVSLPKWRSSHGSRPGVQHQRQVSCISNSLPLALKHDTIFIICNSLAKYYRMRGYNVIHPIGWDSFGLPAENAAVERSIAADEWTHSNIQHMKGQMVRLGFDFDWSRELSTSEPEYYRWTQEVFLLLHKRGLVAQVHFGTFLRDANYAL